MDEAQGEEQGYVCVMTTSEPWDDNATPKQGTIERVSGDANMVDQHRVKVLAKGSYLLTLRLKIRRSEGGGTAMVWFTGQDGRMLGRTMVPIVKAPDEAQFREEVGGTMFAHLEKDEKIQFHHQRYTGSGFTVHEAVIEVARVITGVHRHD